MPWPGWEGLAIFFAAWFFGVVLHELVYEVPTGSTLRYYGASLILWTPAIVLLWSRYWRADRTSLQSLFGLWPMRSRGLMLIAAGLALFMIDSVALRGLESVAYALGLSSHWAEYLDEAELYEPWSLRWIVLLNGVLWAPIGEEIMFRGVLFPALRKWMPLSGAALASAVVFAATHYYSWPGFLGLTGFGFACALTAHYTGSLVPCITAHMLINLILVAGYSWVFGS